MKIPTLTFGALVLNAAAFSDGSVAQEPSAFEVFKTVCIDTNLEKEAISAKAVSLRALPITPREDNMANLLFGLAGAQKSEAAWVANLGDRRFAIYFSSMDLLSPGQDSVHTDDCHVVFQDDDARVVDDFDRWVGLSDSEAIKLPPMNEKSYEFEIIDGKHVPLPKAWRLEPTYYKRVVWEAEVTQWRALSLQLTRTKPFAGARK